MVRQTTENRDDWSSCPPGTIGQLHDQLVSERKRQVALRIGGPMLMVMLLGLGVWSLSRTASRSPAEFDFGGVTCSYVQANMQQFKMQMLQPAEQEAIATHLEQCPVCQSIMKEMSAPAMDIADNEVSKTSRVGSQTHRVLIAAIVE